MAEIFISYASEDHESARKLAEALSDRGWSIWWDRKIPLGKSFDEVIEKALEESRCVIVLWSAVSVTSEWVRNEASEAKRRGILVPVFLEPVNAPLAFRLLNGADLSHWDPGEFDKLTERVGELLGQPRGVSGSSSLPPADYSKSRSKSHFIAKLVRSPTAIVGVALLAIAVLIGWKLWVQRRVEPLHPEPPPQMGKRVNKGGASPEAGDTEKAIRDLSRVLGGAVPATSLATAFHVPDLGVRIAFITPEQSASSLGALPPGAVVLEVESDHPVGRAGMRTGDVILSIGRDKISGEDDLRRAIRRLGPGKTKFSFRRGTQANTVLVDCPTCKAE